MNLQAVIEGLLFLSGDEGVTIAQLQGCIDETFPEEIEEQLDKIAQSCQEECRGFELVHFAGKYKFVSKEEVYPYAQRLFGSVRPATLSSAAMETLAIIAYKQPITRAEIEEIRGVGCDMMLKKLTARGLIEEAGRMDIAGRPILYRVTQEFMDSFALESLQELPELPKTRITLDEELFAQEPEENNEEKIAE